MERSDLDYASATEIARLVRTRQISAADVTEHAIARIEARNRSINAFVYTDFEQARNRAKDLDVRIRAGEDVGPLAGVPTAIKDLFNFYPGWPSTLGGIRCLRDFKLDVKSRYATKMEEAGAVVLGITNSPVLGFRGTTDNDLYGPTRNPFDLSRNSGGSSGGTSAAVADGLLPIGDGTDGGGSIRIPAAWCHVFGFQASPGRIPLAIRPNAFGAAAPFLYEGPITRTVEDAALAMSVLAGSDPADPFSLNDRLDWFGAVDQPTITGLRIGFTPDFGGFPVEPAVAATIAHAVRAFEQAGAKIVPLTLDFGYTHDELSQLWCRMISQGTIAVVDSFAENGLHLEPDFPAPVMEWAQKAKNATPLDLHRDQVMRTKVYDVLNAAFSQVDLIAGPTTTCLPTPNGERGMTVGPSEIAGTPINRLIGFCPTFLTNFTGNPAASLPAGLADGLPVGLMLIGPRRDDLTVLSASAAFERVQPWADSYRIPAVRPLGSQ